MKKIFVIANLLLLFHCAGSRNSIRFDKLTYPSSMNAYLYNKSGNVVSLEQGLEKVASFKQKKSYWGMFYATLPLDNSDDIIEKMNNKIRSVNGDGIINLSVKVQNCLLTTIVPVVELTGIIPGCIEATFSGDIVKYE